VSFSEIFDIMSLFVFCPDCRESGREVVDGWICFALLLSGGKLLLLFSSEPTKVP